jgi:hypothetical protein
MTTLSETSALMGTVRALARTAPGPTPMLSVYLDTRWVDEHQRARVRVFLKNETRRAAATAAGALDAELAWIVSVGDQLIAQTLHPDAAGVALFAGGAPPMREVVPVATPFTDTFVVAETACLRPLVHALDKAPRAAALFVDAERARLVALTETGAGEEVTFEHESAIGHHRRGGWALLQQSRYQRHLHVLRARHFDAVATALTETVEHDGLDSIVLAGEPRNLAVFGTHVPPRLAARIVGEVHATRYEPASALAERALELIRGSAAGESTATVDEVLAAAAGGGDAAAGIEAVMHAVNRGAVHRLYLLQSLDYEGRACPSCGMLQHAMSHACDRCSTVTVALELGEAMLKRVLAAGGGVRIVDAHAALARAGGVAAALRYR